MSEQLVRREYLTTGPAEALAGLLDVPMPDVERDGMPMCWHWIYLLDRPAQSELGVDGHVAAGGVPLPPESGWRRMWAGGQIRMEGSLRTGQVAERRTWLLRSSDKIGRSGKLRLAEVAHEITQGGQIVVRERQDIIYREPGALAPTADQSPSARGETLPGWRIPVDPTLLFRFSALTYNGHRIHYDREFATQTEGYPGLVVHGPLQALAMAEGLRSSVSLPPTPLIFDYRLVAPLYEGQGMRVLAHSSEDGPTASIEDDTRRCTARSVVRPLHHDDLVRSAAGTPEEVSR